jgi:hypothetical protein
LSGLRLARPRLATDTSQEPQESPIAATGHRWYRYPVAGGLYLLVSVALWWHVWTAPGGPSSVMTCGCTDAGRGVWYLEWSAFALAHGHSLLYSNWLFHPVGFNLLTDTSIQAVGVVMAPVTLLFGPVAAFNTAATLAPAVTALSMFWLLQRWVRWTPAAFLGGLGYGFSVFVVVQLAYGWLNLALLVLLPPMVACLDELLIRQRRSPVWMGALLGLLVVVEFFVSSEMVLIVAVSAVVAVVLVTAYALVHHHPDLRARLGSAATGLAVAVGVAAALLAYPVWYFVAGPAHLGGSLWSTDVPGDLGNSLGNFWSHLGSFGPVSTRFLTGEAPLLGGYQGSPMPSPSFLGVGLVGVVVVGTIWWRRDRRLWLFGALGLAAALVSLRVGGPRWGPWSLVYHLPIFRNVVQSRFSAVVDLCGAVMLAVIVDRTRSAVGRWWGSRPAPSHPAPSRQSPAPRRLRSAVPGAAAVVVAAVALVGPAIVLAPNVPLVVQRVDLPRWFTTVAPTLPPSTVLLTYPFATADSQAAIPWQALTGMHFAMAGGGGPAGTVARAGKARAGFAVLHAASVVVGPAPATSPSNLSAVRRAMHQWRVTTVVVPDDTGLYRYEQARGSSYGVGLFTAVMGTAPVRQDGAWVWAAAAPPVALSSAAFDRCVALGSAPVTRADGSGGARVAACVLRGGG